MALKPLLNLHLNQKGFYQYFCVTFIVSTLFIGGIFWVFLFWFGLFSLASCLYRTQLIKHIIQSLLGSKLLVGMYQVEFLENMMVLAPTKLCLTQFFNLWKGGCGAFVFEHRTCFIFLGVLKGWDFALFTSANVNELQRFKRRMQLLVPIQFSRNEI